jgi:hypothetical protein
MENTMSTLTKITVKKRASDYHVYLEGRKDLWGCGDSFQMAVGRAVEDHPKDFGIKIDYQIEDFEPKEYAAPVTIVVERYHGRYRAYLENEPGLWGIGEKTPLAIGHLIDCHPKNCGIEFDFGNIKSLESFKNYSARV